MTKTRECVVCAHVPCQHLAQYEEGLSTKIAELEKRLEVSRAVAERLSISESAAVNRQITADSEVQSLSQLVVDLDAMIQELCTWAASAPVKAVEASAMIHGVVYRPEDVAVWDRARAIVGIK